MFRPQAESRQQGTRSGINKVDRAGSNNLHAPETHMQRHPPCWLRLEGHSIPGCTSDNSDAQTLGSSQTATFCHTTVGKVFWLPLRRTTWGGIMKAEIMAPIRHNTRQSESHPLSNHQRVVPLQQRRQGGNISTKQHTRASGGEHPKQATANGWHTPSHR